MVKDGTIAALLADEENLNMVTYTRGCEGFEIVERLGKC